MADNNVRNGDNVSDVTNNVTVNNTKKNDKVNIKFNRDKGKSRFNRRKHKRQWEESNPNKVENGESDEKKLCSKPFERIKKKKMAMLLGYCGVNYYGMQRNPGVRSIEEDLFKALLEAKYISEEEFADQRNAKFQRSSRTDKGVSAARQVVSLNLPLDVNIDAINNQLPPCIKVFSIKRASNRFNSKLKCDARTYSYTLPTYVFEPSITSEEEKRAYRLTAEKSAKINEVLGVYKGAKRYHNFTEKKLYQDPSSIRYMYNFNLERVFVESEMEFAELLVKGQSFMIHQIRKMVGLMIALVRGHTDQSTMEKAFTKEKVLIPTAPGLGLVLDKVHYEKYDERHKDTHDSLAWDDQDEPVQKFKHEQIYPNIVKGEIEGNSMGIWLEDRLRGHSYEPNENITVDKNEETVDYDIDTDEEDDETKEQTEEHREATNANNIEDENNKELT